MEQEMNRDMELEQAAQSDGQEMDQGKLMEEYDVATRLHPGEIIKDGTVVAETENGWLVDVGYKCEKLLPEKEWTHRILIEDVEKPKTGDKIEVHSLDRKSVV